MAERTEVAVIGAGQAGLSIGYLLTEQGRDFVILEREPHLAHPWRCDRWDSFTLVSPNWSLRLPGFPYQGDDPDGFMPRAGVVHYLEEYASSFAAPVRFNAEVTAVTASPAGQGFRIETSAGSIEANQVVVATGMFQQTKQPIPPSTLPASVGQLHSGAYRNPEDLPPGAVLVVGTAQSGCQIAEELYLGGRRVSLCASGAGRVPRRYRGKDIFWWLIETGFFSQPYDEAPPPKSRFAGNPHLSGKDGGRTLNLHQFARDGVTLLGRVRRADNGALRLAPSLHDDLAKADGFAAKVTDMIDGYVARTGLDAPPADDEPPPRDGYASELTTELDLAGAGITSVIWATGYRFDYSWVRFPVLDGDGYPIQQRGVTAVPGLYFLGMHWLHTRKSGLFTGVGDDARHVADAIAARLDGHPDDVRERDAA